MKWIRLYAGFYVHHVTPLDRWEIRECRARGGWHSWSVSHRDSVKGSWPTLAQAKRRAQDMIGSGDKEVERRFRSVRELKKRDPREAS